MAMTSDIPRKWMEKPELWMNAKRFVLDRLTESDMRQSEMETLLGQTFSFVHKNSPRNIISALTDFDMIHFAVIVGSKDRMLRMGPGSGRVEFYKPPVAEAVETVETVVVRDEVKMEVTDVTVENKPVVEELKEEDAEAAALKKVALDTAKLIVNQVDRELEKFLPPELKAKLTFAAIIMAEAGYYSDKTALPMVKRDNLRMLLMEHDN